MTVRSVFIISPAKRVELILSYPAYVGRNFNEILRVLDALQLSAKYRVATPANWQPGDDTVVLPFISDEEAERMFADQGGVRKVRSYLRYVRDPSLQDLLRTCGKDGVVGRRSKSDRTASAAAWASALRSAIVGERQRRVEGQLDRRRRSSAPARRVRCAANSISPHQP